VFRGLFGSKDTTSPQPPKNQIEVVCPVCGAAQYEPRLVVSTFCKRCGVHLKIDKKRVTASEVSKAGGNPEALAPKRNAEPARAAESTAKASASVARPLTGPLKPMTSNMAPAREPVPVFAPPANEDEEGEELGLGAMMQAAAMRSKAEDDSKPAPLPVEKSVPSSVESGEEVAKVPEPLPEIVEMASESDIAITDDVPLTVQEIMQSPVGEAGTPSALQKMRDQGFYRNHHFKQAQCFECDKKFKVGRSSRSANCPSCGAYMSMEDVELNMPSTQAIKTRGDVMIRKRGQLTASHLYAKDLRCFGMVAANIHCLGDAMFKTTGTIIGEVRCRKFIVEKGSNLDFMNEVHAEEIEINAPVKGHFFSTGKLSILGSGAVDGSITGRSINIEPGGELNGSMNIVRAAS
jgi:cytoskeletal protein CcmA (bactofilin family)